MPARPSRHRYERLAALQRRVDALICALDVIPDRHAPMTPRFAQRGWRLVDEVRRALRLTPIPPAARGALPADLVVEILSVLPRLTDPKALGIKATPRAEPESYPRALEAE